MSKRNLFIITLLFWHTLQCFGMEQADTNSSSKNSEVSENNQAKRKFFEIDSESNEYDKEIKTAKKSLTRATAIIKLIPIKKYECSLCPTYSKCQLTNIRVHILKNHYDNPEVRIKEKSSNNVITRLIEVKDLGKQYNCAICKKMFRVSSELDNHLIGKCGTILRSDNESNYNLQKWQQDKEFCTACNYLVTRSTFNTHKKSLKHQIKEANQKSILQKAELLQLSDTAPLSLQIEQSKEFEQICAQSSNSNLDHK